MNIENINKVADFIEKLPNELERKPEDRQWFDLTQWSTEYIKGIHNHNSCGTAACIAGWTCHIINSDLDAGKSNIRTHIPSLNHLVIHNRATRILGLSSDEASDLFIPTKVLGESYTVDAFGRTSKEVWSSITSKEAAKVLRLVAAGMKANKAWKTVLKDREKLEVKKVEKTTPKIIKRRKGEETYVLDENEAWMEAVNESLERLILKFNEQIGNSKTSIVTPIPERPKVKAIRKGEETYEADESKARIEALNERADRLIKKIKDTGKDYTDFMKQFTMKPQSRFLSNHQPATASNVEEVEVKSKVKEKVK